MKRFAITCVSILLLVMIMAGFGVRRSKTSLRLDVSGNNIAQAPITRPSSEMMNQGSSNQGINSLDSFRNEWYSKHLKAMDESSLNSIAESDETYRFLWLRTFHHPIAIRVWRKGEERNMVFKELDGAGGYEPGKLIANRSRRLTTDEWDKFIKLLQRASYWRLPAESKNGGKDGAQWILEGKKDEQYHVVDRWSPEGGSYREACLYLLKLPGQKQKELY
jgi:hypothetical protein